MGTWSYGNFDNDCSADFLSELTGNIVSEIREAIKEPSDLEADEYWGSAMPACIEILNLLSSQKWVGVTLPEESEAKIWKDIFLKVWGESIDALEPKEGHKEKRLSVLENTFNKLIESTQHS